MPLLTLPPYATDIRVFFRKKGENLEKLIAEAGALGITLPVSDELHLAKRKTEWLNTRLLISEAGIVDSLLFEPTGKPYLSSGQHISISHGGPWAGIIVGNHPVGIDIQESVEKLKTISRRFAHPTELTDAANSTDELEYLTTIWSAKEAIFKTFGVHVHFSEDIRLQTFGPSDHLLKAKYSGIHGERDFLLYKTRFDQFIVVFTL